ncbi:hypothetical protein IKG54_01695 [Candidatus Saccharibacteria bacterium]|nr:hypothetical protein [Candidatus Saccharibacteria bacterium]
MRGAESEYFIRWLQDAAMANSYALEPAYGYGRDFTNHYGKIPPYDPAVAMMDDAGFEYVRWRDQKMCSLMKSTGKGGKVLSIACGTMPELRYFEYPKWLFETQHFVCYDIALIDYKMFFDEVGMPVDNIHPCQMNLASALEEETRHMDGRKYDLINIKGFLSYALPMLPEIIPAVVRLLQKPGAKFGFDLQLKNWTLNRNKWLFLWASDADMDFELLNNFNEAKNLVESIIKDGDLPVEMDISQPGFSSNDTAGVFVTLTKRA